jgi:hypothetical protein
MLAAANLHGPSEIVAAMTLYREAAVLLSAAIEQAREPKEVPIPRTPEEAWRVLDALAVPTSRAARPEGFDRARALLSSGDPFLGEGLSPADVYATASAAADATKWLASIVEPRTLHEVHVRRGLRIGASLLVLVFALYELLTPKNLALHKSASASSQAFDATVPAGVTNGELEPTFGVHTRTEPNPWVQVDLGELLPIREVRVFNRAEAIYQDNILPLVLELSDDGRAFTDVARRDEVFTQDKPWIIKLSGRKARYIRVLEPRSPGYIALSEIEVY